MKVGAMPTDKPLRPLIREARGEDRAGLWALLKPVIEAGDSYALPRNWGEEEALAYWLSPEKVAFVAEADGDLVGTYYLRPNQLGGGAHVANCGYVTGASAGGRGVAAAMCAHSIQWAAAKNYRAMQFNFVVSSNRRAIALWQRMGFDIVGRLPDAFLHPNLGFVDALVMYRRL